jgi:hypothetical protein
MAELDLLKDIIERSNGLWESGQHHDALRLLDACIADARQEKRDPWIAILGMHASVISESVGDLGLVVRYCEQVLACEPENALALFQLADVLFQQHQTALAKEYAAKSYALVLNSNTVFDRGLAELLIVKWPEVREWMKEDSR